MNERKPTAPFCPYVNDDDHSWHLLAVDQRFPEPRDPINIHEPEEAIWLCYGALDGRVEKPLGGVWRHLFAYSASPPLLMLQWALWHPESPFGLGLRPNFHGPGRPPRGRRPMVVAYRGWSYMREPDGSLTPQHERVWPWPDPEDFYASLRMIRDGVLP